MNIEDTVIPCGSNLIAIIGSTSGKEIFIDSYPVAGWRITNENLTAEPILPGDGWDVMEDTHTMAFYSGDLLLWESGDVSKVTSFDEAVGLVRAAITERVAMASPRTSAAHEVAKSEGKA